MDIESTTSTLLKEMAEAKEEWLRIFFGNVSVMEANENKFELTESPMVTETDYDPITGVNSFRISQTYKLRFLTQKELDDARRLNESFENHDKEVARLKEMARALLSELDKGILPEPNADGFYLL